MAIAAGMASSVAFAAVSEKEAEQLGTTLTLFGAEKAGNADGTIPAYDGGLPVTTAPDGWKAGSGRYEHGPYDDEMSLFSISAENVDQYKDKLTAGVYDIIKKFPEFRLDVYPTHRSVAHSEHYLSLCESNALNAVAKPSGNGISGAFGCAPFPIPKSGIEAMWNHLLVDRLGARAQTLTSAWLVDASGHLTDITHIKLEFVHYFLDQSKNKMDGAVAEARLGAWDGPPVQVGTKILQKFPMDYDEGQLLSWIYTPGQRRTRLAPEFAYDTPIASTGGVLNYDEQFGFNGQLDRYNWELVGKKEIYIPYNGYREIFAPVKELWAKRFVNPDVSRWELHRVWVVEATLKEGKRHVQPKRTFYLDEDSWSIVASDAYDQGGSLYRVGVFPTIQLWDVQTTFNAFVFYDVNKGTGYASNVLSRSGDYISVEPTVGDTRIFTPEAMTAGGIR